MPYKPTGNPPGRPRKTDPVVETAIKPIFFEDAVKLSRAHKGFRSAAADVSADLHRPPRHKRQPGNRRPVLHPNVIARNG